MKGTNGHQDPPRKRSPVDKMALNTLPYDLLLNIANYLDLNDVHALHLTCKSLHDFSTTRPVYRKLATDLLRRCRALPLKGFQQLTDLTTEQLVRSVNKATRYEKAWRKRAPRPIKAGPYSGVNAYSNYMDMSDGQSVPISDNKWYKIVSAPPGEDVDWLSPITSSYTLCATKKGKVVCWDVQTDKCLAEWNPGEKWELWKCRVEFEERTVYFTMAKTVNQSYDDDRIMEFILMRLTFSDGPSGETSKDPPVFSHVTDFRTTGVVMNVFLLDPSSRLLSAFIWVAASNTIGLYALPDWDKSEYVFIDTGIECVPSSNWSCILYDGHIVIHCEESESAYQHFYPISLLRKYVKTLPTKTSTPSLSYCAPPPRTLTKHFSFPALPVQDMEPPALPIAPANGHQANAQNGIPVNGTGGVAAVPVGAQANGSNVQQPTPDPPAGPPNPFPFPPWYPESAHFVRQWWPSLPHTPRVSCTVVLLAAHDQVTRRTRFVLAQHYFRVPLNHADWFNGGSTGLEAVLPGCSPGGEPAMAGYRPKQLSPSRQALIAQDDALMHMWYVSTPFEVVRVFDGSEDEDENGTGDRPRPLVAVDFGHAVWIEYCDIEGGSDLDQNGVGDTESESEAKSLRFVTFPSFRDECEYAGAQKTWVPEPEELEGQVRTLEVPDELDLGAVETINIDQSQGAIILSDRDGKIYILCYE